MATTRSKRTIKPSQFQAQHENAVLANNIAKSLTSKQTKKKPGYIYVDEDGQPAPENEPSHQKGPPIPQDTAVGVANALDKDTVLPALQDSIVAEPSASNEDIGLSGGTESDGLYVFSSSELSDTSGVSLESTLQCKESEGLTMISTALRHPAT
ncbi:MAG TPA: hypothetical protein VGO47_01510 [Chlamydiales bacterium]|nr:hypothetical protein [Chlamydiales bacterium]